MSMVTENTSAEREIAPKELAFMRNVAVSTVYMWINDGLPCSRSRGTSGAIRIKLSDYEKWRCGKNA